MKRAMFLFLPAAFLMFYSSTFAYGVVYKADSIHVLERITLGGVPQTILITGKDRTKPILLFVHGGPGFSEIALVRKYDRGLDNYFMVVNWDQRGTNLSYTPLIPRTSMTMEQIIADGHNLVTFLKRRFHQNKIFLLGHSWGSVVAITMASRYPNDFFAYIGVGQVADMQDNERVSTQFALQMAMKENNRKAIKELKAIMPYPAPSNTLAQLLFRGNGCNSMAAKCTKPMMPVKYSQGSITATTHYMILLRRTWAPYFLWKPFGRHC